MMPPEAAEYRAEQVTLLSGMIHSRRTDPRLGEWLARLAESPLAADPHSDSGTVIRQSEARVRQASQAAPIAGRGTHPDRLVGPARLAARARARRFPVVCAALGKDVRAQAGPGRGAGLYRKCLRSAARRLRARRIDRRGQTRARPARNALVPLVAAIAASGRTPVAILARHYPRDEQDKFGRAAAAKLGFDFRRGRLDSTAHPFCSGVGPHDCRITTRYDEHYFPTAFFGILHEAGHGIYDQGLRTDLYGLPPSEAISLGIHESQSRLWENLVARSLAFWKYFFPLARQAFPAALADVKLDDLYFAINDVRPSLIRVEADEATYNLHILIRFELEQALLADELPVADLPAAWTEKYRQYLGLTPPSDADGGCRTFIGGAGLVGYFPTYSLGNLYSAQLFDQADADLGGLAGPFAQGRFEPLGDWLRRKNPLSRPAFHRRRAGCPGHRQTALAPAADRPLAA